MNKLFAIAVLFGVISAQEIFEPTVTSANEELTGLDIDPRSIHHGDEKKNIEDALARKDESSKKKHGLFHGRDQKGKNGKLDHKKITNTHKKQNAKGLFNKARQHSSKKGGSGRHLQKSERKNSLMKMKADHKLKKATIDARKVHAAQAANSTTAEKVAAPHTKMTKEKAEKIKKMQYVKEQRSAVLAKKFKLTPEGAIMKDAEGKPIKKD